MTIDHGPRWARHPERPIVESAEPETAATDKPEEGAA